MFDVLMDIYESAGYDKREAAFEIVEHNIHGLDIDQRAYQLAYFAVMMKGRGYNRRFLRGRDGKPEPKVYAIVESNEINRKHLQFFGTHLSEMERNLAVMQIEGLLDTFKDAREYGSILYVDACDWDVLERFVDDLGTTGQISFESVGSEETQESLRKLVRAAKNLGQKYDAVVTNPPYMGASNMNPVLPVFCIREKDYVNTVPAKESAFRSLVSTFRNGEFRKFVGSDIFYWIALTMFQTGLPFFVTSLLKLPETMTTLYFVGMTALSLVFYVPVNKLTPKLGKKKMILFAFAVFSLAYFYTGFMGKISFIPATVQGVILTVAAALPMAIFGILPQAVVADIAQSDSIKTGSNREGMFYAARTFAFKLGQSLSMLIFTAVSTIGSGDGTGYRMAAFGAAVFCCIGGIILVFYNEKKINGIICGKQQQG